MIIADRVRQVRNEKHLSQGDIEKRTGLLRCYISRVENGHTVPAVETLEKIARALEMPLYQLLYDGDGPPVAPVCNPIPEDGWGSSGKSARYFNKVRSLLGRTAPKDRQLVVHVLSKMSKKGTKIDLRHR
jgi:transcriptional regulator with XRE-family HTH domain